MSGCLCTGGPGQPNGIPLRDVQPRSVVDSGKHRRRPGIRVQHHLEELLMNPYPASHSENEWSKNSFLTHENFLVTAAVAGQDESFVELCRRTSGRAFTAIYRITQNR